MAIFSRSVVKRQSDVKDAKKILFNQSKPLAAAKIQNNNNNK